MKIEDEIQQPKFKHEFHKLGVNLIYTAAWLNYRVEKMLNEHELTTAQFNLLRILRGQYPNACTVNLLIERMIDKSSNASRIVDKLIEKKLVERKQCKEDRRAVDVMITNGGLNLLKEIDKREDEMFSVFNTLKKSEAKQMNELLDKLRGNNKAEDGRQKLEEKK